MKKKILITLILMIILFVSFSLVGQSATYVGYVSFVDSGLDPNEEPMAIIKWPSILKKIYLEDDGVRMSGNQFLLFGSENLQYEIRDFIEYDTYYEVKVTVSGSLLTERSSAFRVTDSRYSLQSKYTSLKFAGEHIWHVDSITSTYGSEISGIELIYTPERVHIFNINKGSLVSGQYARIYHGIFYNDFYADGYYHSKSLDRFYLEPPKAEFKESLIKVRKDTESIDLDFTVNYDNTTVGLYDNLGELVEEKTVSGSGTFTLDPKDFYNGTHTYGVRVSRPNQDYRYAKTVFNWDYKSTPIVFDVDLDGYSYVYGAEEGLNLGTYTVFSPEDATLYLSNYNNALITNVSAIKSGAVKSIDLVEGWNTISLNSTYSNKVFNAYVLSDTNVILKKYHFAVTSANDKVDAYRSNNKLYLQLASTYFNVSENALNVIKERISVLGDILIEIGASGNVTADYEVIYSDYENDPQKSSKFLYVHSPGYFDNNQGLASFSGVEQSAPITTFDKVGLYELYYQGQDNADSINETDFTEFDKWSNSVSKTILVHRKPFAILDIAYVRDDSTGAFLVLEVMKDGYDLDHINDIGKGIIETQFEWKNVNDEVWLTSDIPPTLSMSSDYLARYRVKDAELAWSEWNYSYIEVTNAQDIYMNTIMSPVYPTPVNYEDTVTATTTIYSGDSITSVTGSFNGGSAVDMTKISTVGTKTVWTRTFNVGSLLADGVYNYHTMATTSTAEIITDDDLLNVFTPISLVGDIPSTLMVGSSSEITATTSKYVDRVNITLYSGTTYETTESMTRVSATKWSLNYTPNDIPGGNYSAVFDASVPTSPRKYEYYNDRFNVISLAVDSVSIWGEWNHWRGQVDLFGERKTIEPHRFLSLEKIYIDVETLGSPDEVLIEMSDELKAMYFTDENNNVYSYEEHIGYTVDFPVVMANTSTNSWYHEYILPLAPSTKSIDDDYLREPYFIKIILKKGNTVIEYIVDDIEITGNTIDHVYMQSE